MKKDLIIVLLLVLPAFAQLLRPGYFPMHDDLQSMRQLEMDKCFQDGQVPCRWVPDMGYGYGYPLFNFYPPFPFLLGQVFTQIGLPYIDTVKAVGVLGFVFTALVMYVLGKEFWGRSGGVIASIMYTYAPYHSLDFYVRGAMNEFWAMAFYPAIFFCFYKLIKTHAKKWVMLSAVSLSGLMLSHNLMLMIFVPFLSVWLLYWLWKHKSKVALTQTVVAGIWGFSMAAFFTLPVVFEQKYAHVETLISGYFNYLAHFLNVNQLFIDINWGYGESILGPGDTMSFALGYLQWIIPLVVFIGTCISSKRRTLLPLSVILFASFAVSVAMTHARSTPIWIHVEPLHFLQFPWRFLTVAVFFLSFLSGGIVTIFSAKITPFLVAAILFLNANYFRPREWYPDMTDEKKFSGRSWQLLMTSGIFDYLPIWAPLPPVDQAGDTANIVKGIGTYKTILKQSHRQEFKFMIESASAHVQLQTFYFPGWTLYVNDEVSPIDPKSDPVVGRIEFDLVQGDQYVRVEFKNTPIRTLGNTLSFAGLLALLFWLLYGSWAKITQWTQKSH